MSNNFYLCFQDIVIVTYYKEVLIRIFDIHIYLSYQPSARFARQVMDRVFLSFYGPSAKRADHKNKEGKNEDP